MGLLGADVAVQATPLQAVGSCICMTTIFVATLYLLPSSIRRRPRDDPQHIQARFVSVATACSAAVRLFLVFTAPPPSGVTGRPAHRWLGVTASALLPSIVYPLLCNVMLFIGPIAVSAVGFYVDWLYELRFGGVLQPQQRPPPLKKFVTQCAMAQAHNGYVLVRNLVVGPVSEELVFRACMIPLLLSAGWTLNGVIFGAPVMFGLAHIHHAVQRIRDGTPVTVAVVGTLFQLTYTSVFGWFAGFVFLRTSRLLPCILCHAFCNFMGVPDLPFIAPHHFLLPSDVVCHRYRWLLLAAYALGILAFAYTLLPLTDPAIYDGSEPLYWSKTP